MVRIRRPSLHECPICMEAVSYGVETNCGHMYCAQCILRVWQSNYSYSNPMKCPYCRQDVTVILTCFTEEENNTAELDEAAERNGYISNINEYNRLYSSHPRSVWGYLRDLPTILKHVGAELFTWRGIEFLYRLRVATYIIVAVFYTFFPFDIIPEGFLGIIGLVDDVVIVLFLLVQVSILYRTHIGNRINT